MKLITYSILSFFALFAHQALYAQKNDERLSIPFAQLEIKHKIDANTISFKQPVGKRTQVVYIDNETDIFDKFEVRQIYSTIHESTKPLDLKRLQTLLLANGKKKIGAFEMVEKEGVYFILFTAKVPAILDATNLKSVIDMVATVADGMEDNMFMTDEW